MKEKEERIPSTEKIEEATYNKEQLLSSKKYKDRKDMLSALLEEDTCYTIKQVEAILEGYQKRRVK